MSDSMDDDVSASLDKMVQDARELYDRLIMDEETANQLLCKANLLSTSAATMKEYQETNEMLDEETNGRPRSNILSTILTESKQLHQLQNENRQLRMALEDHQFALELVMSKYRQQVCQLLEYHRKMRDQPVNVNSNSYAAINKLSSKVNEMAAVMMKAIALDEENIRKKEEVRSQLQMENETLKELVKIALQFQSLRREDVPNDILN